MTRHANRDLYLWPCVLQGINSDLIYVLSHVLLYTHLQLSTEDRPTTWSGSSMWILFLQGQMFKLHSHVYKSVLQGFHKTMLSFCDGHITLFTQLLKGNQRQPQYTQLQWSVTLFSDVQWSTLQLWNTYSSYGALIFMYFHVYKSVPLGFH